jgi:hypothetical protein
MADFVAVLKKTIDGLPDKGPAMREKVYDRARATIDAKLKALTPQPPQAVADRQREALENAIRDVEAAFAPAEPAFDPLSDSVFDDVFSSFPEKEAHAEPPPFPEQLKAERSATPPPPPPPVARRDEPVFDDDTAEGDDVFPPADFEPEADRSASAAPIRSVPPKKRARGLGRWLAAAVVLIALAGGGYAAWTERDTLTAMLADLREPKPAEAPVPAPEATPEQPAAQPTETAAAAPQETPPAAQAPAAAAGSGKFTQRLTENGSEIDAGPASGPNSVGEGTSVAPASQLAEAQTPPAEPTPSPQTPPPAAAATVPVGQQAMFYEERTSSAAGTADRGSTVWSVVQESPGGEQPPEAAIRAEVSIPSRDLQLRLTIRRNADPSLPASHIIEMIFLTPDDFAGGGINNVLRITMKPSEQDAGNPLFGIPAKIADGFFLVALSDGNAELQANTTLMRREGWIDIPIVYKSGRRALVTLEKGIPGEEAFTRALDAWQSGQTGNSG